MNIFFTKEKEYYAFTHQELDEILLTMVEKHDFSNYSS
jgi:hypothetical protein